MDSLEDGGEGELVERLSRQAVLSVFRARCGTSTWGRHWPAQRAPWGKFRHLNAPGSSGKLFVHC